MKKLILAAALSFATIGITSCSSDRDDMETTTPKYNVTGTWKMSEYKNDNGAWSNMAMLNYYITLNSDKTFKTNYLGVIATGTYTYDNKDLVITTSSYGTDHIKIKTMSSNTAEVEMFNPSNTADKIELRLVK